MGANLCGLRQSSPEQLPIDNRANGPHLDPKMSFIDLMTPGCLKTEKRKQLHQEGKVAKVTRVKRVTLGEWLVASPAVRRDGISSANASEIQVPKQSNNRVCPWMSSQDMNITGPSPYVEINANFTLARDSFSLERQQKVEETTKGLVPCLNKSQSGKLKKRVSFRLPKEADIFIFYSPEEGVAMAY